MADNKLFAILTGSNDFLEDADSFRDSVKEAFAEEELLGTYIIKLHEIGVIDTIDDALELDQDLMDDLIEDLEDLSGAIVDETTARKAVYTWFEAYGESMLGLLCSVEREETEVNDTSSENTDVRDIPIDELELSVRSYNCLRRAGIRTLGEIADKTPEEMMKIRNLGRKSLEEVLAKLKEYGLSLRDSEEVDADEDDGLGELVSNLGMSARTTNILRRNCIDTLRELCCCSEEEVDRFRIMGRKSKEEIVEKMDELGVSFRPDGESKHLYLYPERVKKIAEEKASSWEYLLFIEAGICNYNWLRKYREQKVTLWQNDDEDDDDRIETMSELSEYMHEQTEKLSEFVSDFGACMNDSIKPSFGEPGEPGDEYEIIDSTETFFGIYKRVIAWKLSFQDVNADEEYHDLIEQLCLTAESLCENIDVMYQKLVVAKKKIEDIEAGILDPSDTEIDINIKFDIKMEGLQRALHELTGEDEDEEDEEDEEEYVSEELTDDVPKITNKVECKRIKKDKAGRTIKEWLLDNNFELPLTLYKQEDENIEYVLQTIKDNCVYAEVIQGGKSTDYCRFNIDTKELFVIKED